jgi:hypothetical protein
VEKVRSGQYGSLGMMEKIVAWRSDHNACKESARSEEKLEFLVSSLKKINSDLFKLLGSFNFEYLFNYWVIALLISCNITR